MTGLDCCKTFCIFCHLFKEKMDTNISPSLCKIFVELLYPQVTLAGRMGICASSKWEQVCSAQIQGWDCSDTLHTSAGQFRWCGWLSKLLGLCWKEASSASTEKYPAAKLEPEAAVAWRDCCLQITAVDGRRLYFPFWTRMGEKILPVKLLTSWVYMQKVSVLEPGTVLQRHRIFILNSLLAGA